MFVCESHTSHHVPCFVFPLRFLCQPNPQTAVPFSCCDSYHCIINIQYNYHYHQFVHFYLTAWKCQIYFTAWLSMNCQLLWSLKAKPSGPSCVYCWPSGWLMAKLRELDMRRNGMQNTSLLSKSATCEQKFLLVVVIVMAKLRKTNQMQISSSSHSRSGWWQSFVAQGRAKYLPSLKDHHLLVVEIVANSISNG